MPVTKKIWRWRPWNNIPGRSSVKQRFNHPGCQFLKLPVINKPISTLFILFFLSICISCHRDNSCSTSAIIVRNSTGCLSWGINVGTSYISDNIPDQFKVEGLRVCVDYELYDDMRLCACCGGTRARIINMTLPPE